MEFQDAKDAMGWWSHHKNWSNALPKRNRIPSAYLTLDGPFVEYLTSDDTRLPPHPALKVRSGNDEDDEKDMLQSEPGSEPASRLPIFDEEIRWIRETIGELQDPATRFEDSDFGVVVGGGFGLFDDANWATVNGTQRCIDVNDVMMVLKCTTRLRNDFAWQRVVGEPLVRLSRFVDHHACHVFRAFVEGGRVIAICQRSVDQLHQALIDMTEAQHQELFDAIRRPIEGKLVATIATSTSPNDTAAAWIKAPSLVIDVFFEGGQLPVQVVSCRAVQQLDDLARWEIALQRQREFAIEAEDLDPESKRQAVLDFQWLPADALTFRVFRTLEDLRKFAFTADGDVRREVAIARSMEELFGDGKSMASAMALPIELQHPEWFVGDAQLQEMMARLGTQSGGR
jgi:hypothetical protein